jgi:inner membrane protein
MLDSANAELLWFLAGLVLILAELMVPGFVILFFGVGAWVTALLTGLGWIADFNIQLLVFLGSSLLSLALFRSKGKKVFEGRVTNVLAPTESMEDLLGKRAVVIARIAPDTPGGKVEFHGTSWNADADVPIDEGQVVEILDLRELRLKVRPVK